MTIADYTEFTIASTVIKDGRDLRLPSPSVHNGFVIHLKWFGYVDTVYILFFRTEIPDVLPHSIFSLQIDPPPDSATLKMYPIMMMFDVVSHYTFIKSSYMANKEESVKLAYA